MRTAWIKVTVEQVPPAGAEFEAWCKTLDCGKERAALKSDHHALHWGLRDDVHAGAMMVYWDGDPIGVCHPDDDIRYEDDTTLRGRQGRAGGR